MRTRSLLRFSCGSLSLVAALTLHASRTEAASGNVKYYGGHVISHVEVVPVIWGTGVSAQVTGGAEKFYATIVNSPYIDWLGEYDSSGLKGTTDMMPGSNQHISRGTVLPLVNITPANTSTTIADMDIQTELLAQLAAGKLPMPRTDREGGVDTVYMIAFPPGMKISDFGGSDVCSVSCAYHWTVTVPGVTTGVPYAVMPDCSGAGSSYCSVGSGVFDTYTGDAAHELMEAITDPECGLANAQTAGRPLGWFDDAQANGEGEVGDLCISDPSAFTQYQGYTVQKIWSQRLAKCITEDPTLKLCDGKTRPCKPCSPSDCTGATPTCDMDMGSPQWGQCVSGSSGSGGSGGSSMGNGGSGGANGGNGGNGGGGGDGGSSGGGAGGAGGASSGGGAGGDTGAAGSAGNGDAFGGGSKASGCAVGVRSDSDAPWGSLALAAIVGVALARSALDGGGRVRRVEGAPPRRRRILARREAHANRRG